MMAMGPAKRGPICSSRFWDHSARGGGGARQERCVSGSGDGGGWARRMHRLVHSHKHPKCHADNQCCAAARRPSPVGCSWSLSGYSTKAKAPKKAMKGKMQV